MDRDLSFSEALRQAIRASGLNPNQLQNATGVLSDSVSRFMRGEQSLRLDAADKIATFLRIRTVQPGKQERRPEVMKANDYINAIVDAYNSSGPRTVVPHSGGHYVTLEKFCDGEKIQALFKRNDGAPEIQVGVVLDSSDPSKNQHAAVAYRHRLALDIAAGRIVDVPTASGSNVGLLRRIPVANHASLGELIRAVVAEVKHILERLGRP
jgi:transcriptional regulator with XRE-family HTH domain